MSVLTRKEKRRLGAMAVTVAVFAAAIGCLIVWQYSNECKAEHKTNLSAFPIASGIQKGESESSARFEQQLFSFDGYEVVGTDEAHGIVALYVDSGADKEGSAVERTAEEVASSMTAGGWSCISIHNDRHFTVATFRRSARPQEEPVSELEEDLSEMRSALLTVQEVGGGVSVLIQMY